MTANEAPAPRARRQRESRSARSTGRTEVPRPGHARRPGNVPVHPRQAPAARCPAHAGGSSVSSPERARPGGQTSSSARCSADGALGVDVIGDNPTVSALDPDHPMCAPAVGTTGVSLCRKQDFIELLAGHPARPDDAEPFLAARLRPGRPVSGGRRTASIPGSCAGRRFRRPSTPRTAAIRRSCRSPCGCACPWTRSSSRCARCRGSTRSSRTRTTSPTAGWTRWRR